MTEEYPDHPQVYLFIGRSGSGKGTQAKLLFSHLEKEGPRPVITFSAGDTFRELAAGDTHTASLINQAITSGGLLPTFLPVWLWSDAFIQKFSGQEDIVVEGIGRRQEELEVFAGLLEFYDIQCNLVYLDLSRETAMERMLARGRADDTTADIQARLDWFDARVVPAIDWAKNHRRFMVHTIDSEPAVSVIQADIIQKLGFSQ